MDGIVMSKSQPANKLEWRHMEVVEGPHKINLTGDATSENADSFMFTIDAFTVGAAQIVGEPVIASVDDELPILNLHLTI